MAQSQTANGSFLTNPAPNSGDLWTPLTVPKPGTYLGPKDGFKNAGGIPKILQPLKIRSLEFKNRIAMSPMAQYSCKPGTGIPTDYHLVHYGQIAMRGVACIMTEATAISANGRMTPEDCGIWDDKQIPAWRRIVNFVHSQGALMGLQLNHAGRRGSVYTPQILGDHPELNSHVAPVDAGGWKDVWSASPIPYYEKYAMPVEMSHADIEKFKKEWAAAVKRALKAGFDLVELHASHGYLLHNFMSPLSNQRNDKYGGSLENRMRLVIEIAKVTRDIWPKDKPVFCRLSVTDWHAKGEKDGAGNYISWGMEQSKVLIRELLKLNIDFFDITTGGLDAAQLSVLTFGECSLTYTRHEPAPAHNAPLSKEIREEFPKVLFGTVGLIKSPSVASKVLEEGSADIVSIGRELFRRADFMLDAANEAGAVIQLPTQWHRAITWSDLIIPGPAV